MKSFDVLSRDTDIFCSRILEASAGTGKTFAIENLVVRFVAAGIPIDSILAVTFTRKAASELKERIRGSIRRALEYLESGGSCDVDYLNAYKGREKYDVGRCLRAALFSFDNAGIFTIHSFCSRMLRENAFDGDVSFDMDDADNNITRRELVDIVKDFLRTDIIPSLYSFQQVKIILGKYKDVDILSRALLDVKKPSPLPSFDESLRSFSDAMASLKAIHSDFPLVEDFIQRASSYKGTCNRKGEVKKEFIDNVATFERLLKKSEWSGKDFDEVLRCRLLFPEALVQENVKSRAVLTPMPKFYEDVERMLSGIIGDAGDPLNILLRMAYDCRKVIKKALLDSGKSTYDDILETLQENINNPIVVDAIRRRYRVVIIDEFQDTDPVQWDIFKTLFLNRCYLYLVGDPKQSIYAFRNADIYTYLDAADSLGKECRASLDTNFRSHGDMVDALNAIFCEDVSPALMPLPKTSKTLGYRTVMPSGTISRPTISDERESVHFFIAEGHLGASKSWPTASLENDALFPFIVQEIHRLHYCDGILYRDVAVLVRDRYQARSLEAFMNGYDIPTTTRSSQSVATTPAFTALCDILKAVITPRDESFLLIALAGDVLAWTDKRISAFDDNPARNDILEQVHVLREALFGVGFAGFFQRFLHSSWNENGTTVAEDMLSRSCGDVLYHDLLHLSDLAIEYQTAYQSSPEGVLSFLKDLESISTDDDPRLMIRRGSGEDAVNILTLHISKGLEFGIVFAVGLANRDRARVTQRHDSDEGVLELDAEKMRQLYVGMTRAKYRLYVPVAVELGGKKVLPGKASPIELFLAQFNKNNSEVMPMDADTLTAFIDNMPTPKTISYSLISDEPLEIIRHNDRNEVAIFPPEKISVPGSAHFVQSFSSIVQESRHIAELSPPHDWESLEKTIHTMPAGKATGITLHQILEWGHAGSLLDNAPWCDWKDVVDGMLFEVNNTALKEGADAFCLSDVPFFKKVHELEFLLPPGKSYGDLMTGFIDMFFEYNGLYYLVDWKSNWLGPDISYYRQENLHAAMKEHDYHLQASIYALALKRYLKNFDERPFKECFGGAFYIFLRGIDRLKGPEVGIYFFTPEVYRCAE